MQLPIINEKEFMINILPAECDLCGCCVGVCPEDSLELSISELTVNRETCTGCSQCVWACPLEALKFVRPRYSNE